MRRDFTSVACHPECAYCWPYCHRWLVARFEAECQQRDLELDVARELEFDPFEEIELVLEDAFYCEIYYS